jgi:hypothetical protein
MHTMRRLASAALSQIAARTRYGAVSTRKHRILNHKYCMRPVMTAAALEDDGREHVKLHKEGGEATFAALDADSTGGLGGTSSDVFGPLVCWTPMSL